jgi:phospholipase/carboxylesterase
MAALKQLTGPKLAPAGGRPPRQMVMLLHGYGANGDDLIGLAPQWQRRLPDAVFLSPDAPEPCEMSPMGRQWFSLGRHDPTPARRDPKQAAADRLAGAERAAPILNGFIDQELERYGLTDDRLALVGFSQGTMMSLYIGLRRANAPACILGFSGALPGADTLEQQIRQKPPVMLIHGDADEMVPVQSMFDAAAALGAAGVAVQWHVSNGIGHGIAPDGLELGGYFLADTLQSHR